MTERNRSSISRFILEAATIAIVAILIAVISNFLAPRERKLALVGDYPNALRVTKRSDDPIPNRVPAVETPPSEQNDSAIVHEIPESNDGDLPTSDSAPARRIDAANPEAVTPTAPAAESTTPSTSPSPGSASHRASRAAILERFPATPDKQYEEISGDDAAWLHANGVLFLDARRTSDYEAGHIAGARSLPVWEADIMDRVGALLSEVTDQEMPIVVYCSGGDCEDSHMLAEKLWGVFYSNVLVYKDGFPDWRAHGRPIDTGDAP